jgi:2-hydroxychromene-2-carboxylate isomerase
MGEDRVMEENHVMEKIHVAPVTSVDFHFDVMCPYAYQTSLWIREVRDRTGLEVNWRFFSLEEVNREEGKKHPWERKWSYGWSMMRIGALLRRHDMDDLDRWYAAAGRALHVDGYKPHEPEVARELLGGLGLDPGLVDEAIADPTTHDEVRAEHCRVVDAGGYGVPTLFFPDGQCLFGPVLIDPPTGDAALRLWDAVVAWTEFPHLYELQRPKTRVDEKRIVETFRPYLGARDWVSVNRGEIIEFPRGSGG